MYSKMVAGFLHEDCTVVHNCYAVKSIFLAMRAGKNIPVSPTGIIKDTYNSELLSSSGKLTIRNTKFKTFCHALSVLQPLIKTVLHA